ncbi:MAG: response regulator [Deltaproteobacteria bacterium]|jgi:putative two-component system response regulator|nr:response regulator [Deltaproteobacteria bacterium]
MHITKRQKIMLVDDNMANLVMGKQMLKDSYEVYPIPSAAKLFEVMEHVEPALILLDVMMPEMDGYEAIIKLKAEPRWADVPVIFLTSKNDETSELEGLSLGAIDYVAKPFSAPLLLQRIENQLLIVGQRRQLKNYNDNLQDMVAKKTQQVVDLQNAVLSTVAEMVEFRDNLTGGHVTRTQMYLNVLVDKMLEEKVYLEEVSGWDLNLLVQSAQLHDVGKIAISDAILNKPGKLTEVEFEEMKKHVIFGLEVIDKIATKTPQQVFLRHARIFAGTHHEKWDGTGYPNGIKGEKIPIEGRLMAIADVYDALISKRPYKEPMPLSQAEKIIIDGRNKHFDSQLIDIFIKVTDKFAEIAKIYDT